MEKHWGRLKSWEEVWMMVPRENTKLENTKLEIPFVGKKIEFQIKRVNFYLRRR
jgi:hypothetical protein